MGRPGETTVMCFHGLGSSPRAFDAIATSFAAKACAFECPCFSGFGARSRETVADKPLTDTVLEIRREILARDLSQLILIGHSVGGIVAVRVAASFPERIAAVISVEGNLVAEDCGTMSRDLANCQTLEHVEIHRDRLIALADGTKSTGWKGWVDDLRLASPDTLRKYARDAVEESEKGDLAKIFSALPCRKLYVHGDEYLGHPVLGKLKGVPVLHISSAGHFVMQDQPEAFGRVVSEML